MPNYGLVVTPTYNPMSYEQYIQPFKDYAQVYNATADQIDALEMEANQWEKLADSDIDAPQYQQYKNYADDLRKYANEIATQGLSSRTRAGLSRMRQRYTKEIKPIEEAYNYRQKLAEEQRKLNPTGDLQYTVDFTNVGLGELMRNPNMGYSARSLSQMEAEASEQAKALSTRILSKPAQKLLDEYTYYFTSQGVSAGDAQKWWNDQKSNNTVTATEVESFINDIYNQTKTKYNIYGEDSPYTVEQDAVADNSIISGIFKGLSYQGSYTPLSSTSSGSGRGSGSGSGDSDYGVSVPIGYEITAGDETYTAINERGSWEFYNSNGQRVYVDYDGGTNKTTILDYNGEKINEVDGRLGAPKVRYVARPLKNGSNKHYIFDAKYGTRVMQDGQTVTLDVDNQTWDAIDRRVEDVFGETNGLEDGWILEMLLTNDGSRIGSNTYYKSDDLYKSGTPFTNAADAYTTYYGTDLTNVLKNPKEYSYDERDAVNAILSSLPSIIKDNLNDYVFVFGKKANEANNKILKIRKIGKQKTHTNSPYERHASQNNSIDSNFVPK